jgi:hypothetical protein
MGSVTLTFGNDKEKAETEPNYILVDIYSYEYAYIHIEHNDSLQEDNTLYLYGGAKPELKIEYYSSLPNPFFSGVLRALRDTVDDKWDIVLDEVRSVNPNKPVEPVLEGYDVYIFEHTMPKIMPTDGLVILCDPDVAPPGAGFYLGNGVQSKSEIFMIPGEDENHPLLKKIDPSQISLTKVREITNFGASYIPLMYCDKYPVMLASVAEGEKIVVLPFSLNHSNLPVIKEFPTLILNMLEYYIPSTLEGFLYEVNDTVPVNSRSPELGIEGPGVDVKWTQFPNTLFVTEPGVYTFTQTPISGEDVIESIYVKIPAAESNIHAVVDTLENPYVEYEPEILDLDLVYYFAMALVILLFCEWLLQLKEYF